MTRPETPRAAGAGRARPRRAQSRRAQFRPDQVRHDQGRRDDARREDSRREDSRRDQSRSDLPQADHELRDHREHRGQGDPGSRLRRRLAIGIAAVAVLVPYVVTLTLFGQRQLADLAFAQKERDGVSYARALVPLVAATADGQSAAVAGSPVDTEALTEARAAVEAVDDRLGASLGTSRRWDDLGAALDAVLAPAGSPAAAYQAWSQVVDLELALAATVGDSSNLVLDPELDTNYVIDAALVRLPRVIALAGRVSDLALLSDAAAHDAPGLTDAQRQAAGAAERVRAEFADQIESLDRSLRVAFGDTRSATLGPALLNRLDRLRDASNVLAPPGQALGVDLGSAGVDEDRTARIQVRDAAVALAASANGEIDALLQARIDALTLRDRIAIALAALAGVGILVAGWIARGPRRRPATPDVPDVPDEPSATATGDGSADGPGDGSADGSGDGSGDRSPEVDALFGGGGIVRSGRVPPSSSDAS